MRRHSILIGLLLFVVVVISGGVAFGFWSGSGAGTSQARVGNPLPLSLSAAAPDSELSPGGASSTALVARNPNPYPVTIGTLSLDTSAGTNGFDVDAAHSGCDLSALSFAPQDNGGAGWVVPPKAGDADGMLAIDVDDSTAMSLDASNACQGATFTVHLVVGS